MGYNELENSSLQFLWLCFKNKSNILVQQEETGFPVNHFEGQWYPMRIHLIQWFLFLVNPFTSMISPVSVILSSELF